MHRASHSDTCLNLHSLDLGTMQNWISTKYIIIYISLCYMNKRIYNTNVLKTYSPLFVSRSHFVYIFFFIFVVLNFVMYSKQKFRLIQRGSHRPYLVGCFIEKKNRCHFSAAKYSHQRKKNRTICSHAWKLTTIYARVKCHRIVFFTVKDIHTYTLIHIYVWFMR